MGQTQDPQWAPPPQQPMGWGGGGMAPVERPMGVTLAAIYLMVVGVLTGLLGGCVAGLSGLISSAGDQPDFPGLGALAAAGAVFGVIILVLGIVSIVAGVGAMQGRGWARITGIIISILGVLGAVWIVVSSGDISSNIFTIIVGVLYALTAWALFAAGPYFARR